MDQSAERLLPANPDNTSAQRPATQLHHGIHYHDFLKQYHAVNDPGSYLEIGVETGATLAFARRQAVAIDPKFILQGDWVGQREETYFFQLNSDDFFSRHDLRKFLPGGVDFAFLDGMHYFEYLLRDFVNTERYSHNDTAIALHDCYPVNVEIAGRDINFDRRLDMDTRGWWAGDVWKLLPILRDFRPELEIAILDCPPTGIVLVKGLDPDSSTLIKAYEQIVAKYRDISLDTYNIELFRSEFAPADSRNFFQTKKK